MNVLFILARYPAYGGIEKVSTWLCNRLCEKLDWVGIYSFDQECEKELITELDTRIHFIKSNVPVQFYSKNNVNQLLNIIRTNTIDVVIYQDSYAPYFKTVVSAVEKTDAKLIVVEHNTPEYGLRTIPLKDVARQNLKHNVARSILAYYKGRYFAYSQHLYKYIKCDKYVLLSNEYIPFFKKLVPFASCKKLMAINNPNPVNPILDFPRKNQVCLFCARLEPQKGIDYLMDIWTIIEKQRKDWDLVVVGDGSLYSYIKETTKRRDLTNVHLEGFQHDTSSYYSSSQIFLLTSKYEGWAMTLFEAKSHGCIPIAFNSFAAAKEVINDRKDGFLIPPYDVARFTETVMALMDDAKMKRKMAENAIIDCERFSIDTISNQWISLFNSLIEN